MEPAVANWFDRLPDAWRERALRVRDLLMEASPAMREVWQYGSTPFYTHARRMCFLAMQGERLVLGFVQGALLDDPQYGGLLERSAHKEIRHYLVPPLDEWMDEEALRHLLVGAVLLNEGLARTGRERPRVKATASSGRRPSSGRRTRPPAHRR